MSERDMHRDPVGTGEKAPSVEPRRQLVLALIDRFEESQLSMERIEAKLKDSLAGLGVRGISKSSVSRYLDLNRTELPDLSVLGGLAWIFAVGDEELAQWQEWHHQAKLAGGRGRHHRRAASRAASADVSLPGAEESPPGSDRSHPGPVLALGDDEAPVGASLAVTTPVAQGPELRTTAGVARVTDVRGDLARGFQLARTRRWAAFAATAVLTLAIVTGVMESAGRGPFAGPGTPPASPRSHDVMTASDTGSATEVEAETDALGGDSRCSPPRQGPSGVLLRACVRVDARQVLFAVKVDNPGTGAVDVTIKVGHGSLGAKYACDPGPAVTHVRVPAGEIYVTAPLRCAVPHRTASDVYQADALIAPGDGTGRAARQLSPKVSVYGDGAVTSWRCAGDVPC